MKKITITTRSGVMITVMTAAALIALSDTTGTGVARGQAVGHQGTVPNTAQSTSQKVDQKTAEPQHPVLQTRIPDNLLAEYYKQQVAVLHAEIAVQQTAEYQRLMVVKRESDLTLQAMQAACGANSKIIVDQQQNPHCAPTVPENVENKK